MSQRSAIPTAEKGTISTMSNSLSEDYLRWLAPQIRENGDDHREYGQLLSIMYEKEFPVEAGQLVPNDENRLADGLDLRLEFCHTNNIPTGSAVDLFGGSCTFLEVLIALSRRLTFAAGWSAEGWAWQLVINLGLDQMSDPITNSRVRRIDRILDDCIWRRYLRNGRGGFFPLRHSREDQKKIELWYQMAAYIDELNPGH